MDENNQDVPALEVHNLSVVLGGHTIIDPISFSVPVGSTTAIIGPNGAGKSVLLKSILRLLPKRSGTVSIFGTPHEQYSQVARLISYIPQKFHFDQDFPLTIKGLFALKSARLLGMSAQEKARRDELLRTVGMYDWLEQKISYLSGGQLQRVLIAYSLMDHPKILMLDEPSAGIDVQGQETIYVLLKRLREKENLTMVLVSHELDVVMQYATQVLCLNKQLLCVGVPHKVLTNEILANMYGTPIGHYHHEHKT